MRRTCEGLHSELGLLGVHLVLDQGVDVGQDKLDLAHRGTQLAQRVGARVPTLDQGEEGERNIEEEEERRRGVSTCSIITQSTSPH